MIYVTYNDSPSGIFSGQVTDVCNFLNQKFHSGIRLVSLISIRNFFVNKQRIKSQFPNAIVLPMIPWVGNWKWNFVTLFLFFIFLDTKKIIARGPFAASLSLQLKKAGMVKWVCFDARGAYDAELNEYSVVENEKIKKNIFSIEKEAVVNSDFRIAVSDNLVKYWKDVFEYSSAKHVVIPCTLNSLLFSGFPAQSLINNYRKEMGFSEEDVVLVYSGSSAGWQSFKLLDDFLYCLMNQNKKIKIMFLVKFLPENMRITHEYKNRIVCKWLNEDQVPLVLSCCDYGILIREKSVTNKVSSPVKFAEYLASGLKIIISEKVGDYSEFVIKNDCGFVIRDSNQALQLDLIPYNEKLKLSLLAFTIFSKEASAGKYQKIVQ